MTTTPEEPLSDDDMTTAPAGDPTPPADADSTDGSDADGADADGADADATDGDASDTSDGDAS